MNLRYHTYELPFRYPFTISKGTKTHQPTLIVELEHRGLKGYGEVAAITYYDVTLDRLIADIERKKSFIEKYALTEPERYWHYLHHLFPENSFLVCALDMAAWDLFGKMHGKPLFQLWGLDPATAPLTDYTLGIDTIEKMCQKIDENPWPIYKVKVGTASDLETLTAIRNKTGSTIRVDANGGWTLEQASELCNRLADLDVEFIEQPLAKEKHEDVKLLRERSAIPLIADESCVTEQDVDRCAGYFHGINIKLSKCGGITPARRMITRARELGLSIMLGCMNESTVGSAALAHLLPAADFADVDGPLLLASDPATGLEYNEGRVSVSGRPGLGIVFHQT